MTQKLTEKEEKDDTGYYTPKNILNPAMFRLAEITRALSEVNMKVDQEKLFDERRHTINMEDIHHEESYQIGTKNDSLEKIEVLHQANVGKRRKTQWADVLKKNEDDIGKALMISLAISLVLLILLLFFWS